MNESIDERVAYAMELHARGFNCAQCVAVATADLAGTEPDTVFRIAAGFGSGMGDHSETCGAITGGIMSLGFANSNGMDEPASRGQTKALTTQLVDRFRQKNGSTICADLKGLNGSPALRSCDGCIEDGVRITCELLQTIE